MTITHREQITLGSRVSGTMSGWTVVGAPAAILVAAFVIRICWVAQHGTILHGEETEYSRLAESLVRSHTYRGTLEGPQLMYPPLLPLVLAAAWFVSSGFTIAGRSISILAGTFLVLGVFLLTRHVYGRRVALVAATIAACHPVLLFLSGVTYSETLYLPLMIGGTYYGLRCIEGKSFLFALVCGTCFGLAYLTRPEALMYTVIFSAAVLLRARRRDVVLIVVPVILLATPYVAYLSAHTGSLRLEGKSFMNYAIGLRMSGGMDLLTATYGIGADLTEEGPFLSPNRFVEGHPATAPLRMYLDDWLKTAWRNRKNVPHWLVVDRAFGSALMVGLVAIGLLYRPWSRRRLVMEAVLVTIVAAHVFILFGMPFIDLRFVVPLLPFVIIWSSKGIDDASRWLVATGRRITKSDAIPAYLLGFGTRCVLVAGFVLMAVGVIPASPAFSPRELALRETGEWIQKQQREPRVMTVAPEVPYYAGGVFLPLPEADDSLALAYIALKAPDFVVLTHELERAHYQERWFRDGLPSASLIHSAGRGDDEVRVYKWGHGGDCD
jgi:hypothetical protein